MKKIILTAAVAALSIGCASAPKQEAPQVSAAEKRALVAEGKQVFMEFGNTLKGHLKGGLKRGGPDKALQVCNLIAPSVAADISKKYGVEVGRTSLKLRNPDNAPDAWEKSVLLKFEERKAAGEDVSKIAYSEVVSEGGKNYFRMMKAIPTAKKPCLACHGGKLKPAIAKRIDELYPDDKARGFKEGDIRGAFTLKEEI